MSESIHPEVRIGHAHLRVADLKRSTNFYYEVLGFDVVVYGPEYGVEAGFLSAGGYHHHIGLNTWESAGGTPPPPGVMAFTTWPSSTPTAGNWPGP